jgi:hypothetical protein
MKRFFFSLIVGGCVISASAQSTTIEAGTIVKLAKATHIAFQTDLIVDGQLLCDTSTIISIGIPDKNCRVMSDNPLKFSSLKIEDGTNYVEADTLLLDGDIIFNNGKLHLSNKITRLEGSILNENETGYIVDGILRKDLKNLSSKQKNNRTRNIYYSQSQLRCSNNRAGT